MVEHKPKNQNTLPTYVLLVYPYSSHRTVYCIPWKACPLWVSTCEDVSGMQLCPTTIVSPHAEAICVLSDVKR